MSDIFREVDDDYRQEQLLRFWHQHAKTIIAALVAAILVSGGIGFWRHRDEQKRELQTAQLGQALDETTAAGSDPAHQTPAKYDAVIAELSAGRKIDAEFGAAHAHAATGDGAGAIKLYQVIAADPSASKAEKELAEISQFYLQVDTGDTPPADRLAALAAENSPWRSSALEIQALLKVRAGDKPGADAIWTSLAKDPRTVEGVKARAAQFAGIAPPGPAAALQPEAH